MSMFAGEFTFGRARADMDAVRRMAAGGRDAAEAASFLSADGGCAIIAHGEGVLAKQGGSALAAVGHVYNLRQLSGQAGRDLPASRGGDGQRVLIDLYRQGGKDMVERLRGPFALAGFDGDRGSLLLARDAIGQKPLWYAMLGDRIVFASEARLLLGHGAVNSDVDMLSLQHFASLGYIPAPLTAWRGVRKLLPGKRIELIGGREAPERYWSPEARPIEGSRQDVLAAVRETVMAAVRSCAVGEGVGVLVSGGLDSSIVLAVMALLAGRAGGIKSFSAGFEDATFDERRYAQVVARHCRTEHREIIVDPPPAEMVDRVLEMYDEPFGDSSALPTWLICRATSEHVAAALVGDGGDEGFGGYDRYRALQLSATMSASAYAGVRLAAWLARPLARGDERRRLRRLVRFADALPLPPARQYFSFRSLFSPDELGRLFTDEFLDGGDVEATERWFCELYEEGQFEDEVGRAQRHDVLTYLPDDGLVKTGAAASATGLELRAPLLSRDVVELGLSLPVEMKVSRWRGKVALREAFADVLPREILGRRKRGFGIPVGRWLREGLRDMLVDALTDPGLLRRGIFREEALVGLLNDHLSGRDEHGHRLWALLALARWLERQG